MGNNKTNIAGSKIQEQGSVKMKSIMKNSFDLMALYGRNTGCSDKDSECRIYHLNNKTGAGMITVYNVFTGISAALTSSAPKIFQNKIYGCIYPSCSPFKAVMGDFVFIRPVHSCVSLR